MALPIFQTPERILSMLQTRWASIIDPFLANPALDSIILPSVRLAVGTNVISHRLGRKLQGWSIVRQRSAASVYDTQDASTMPELTLTLVSSAAVVVDILVF